MEFGANSPQQFSDEAERVFIPTLRTMQHDFPD